MGRDVRVFMNCIILARRALSVSSSSWTTADAFRLRAFGMGGVDTFATRLTIRVIFGSGSRHNAGEVANYDYLSS